ncbi:unnamed protein product [Blepharisma stoltei]|uniref:PHD-type domain-containing protein n=1 Tax=Blepharisma stoltei TaxID=1481888 RepID=A0AAU9I9X7_9CILI|nr:unnamed protein product [Blepharisma stoltei]
MEISIILNSGKPRVTYKMKKLYLKLGDELRNIGEAPNDYNNVIEKSKSLFGVEEPAFKYKDENGLIVTICDKSEYDEFLNQSIKPFILDVYEFGLILSERKYHKIKNAHQKRCKIKAKEPKPKKRRRLIKSSTINENLCENNIKIEEKQVSEAETDSRENEEEISQQEISAIACEICGKRDQEENMLLCDKCNSGCHTSCGYLAKIPEGDWFCVNCRRSLPDKKYKKLLEELKQCSVFRNPLN